MSNKLFIYIIGILIIGVMFLGVFYFSYKAKGQIELKTREGNTIEFPNFLSEFDPSPTGYYTLYSEEGYSVSFSKQTSAFTLGILKQPVILNSSKAQLKLLEILGLERSKANVVCALKVNFSIANSIANDPASKNVKLVFCK